MKSTAIVTIALAGFSAVSSILAAATPKLAKKQSGRTSPLLTVFPGQGPLPTLAEIINLNLTQHTFLPIDNIQGDVFVGMKKPKELFFFFHINDATAFKTALRTNVASLVTSTATLVSPAASQPLAFLNIAFSSSGLNALGITDNLGDPNFAAGQFAEASALGDVPGDWETPFAGTSIHGVFLIGSDTQSYIDNLLTTVTGHFGTSITEKTRLLGAARPGSEAGHEHFGFLDGISNPAVTGFATASTIQPGQGIIPTGTILLGRLGDTTSRPLWTLDGSFLVFRKLKQLVPEFNQYLTTHAVQNAAGTLTTQEGANLLGARMVGRWKSGAPVDITPLVDNPTLGADPTQNNNFDYGHLLSDITKDQSRCPFSAHIRKTRPRADLLNLNTVNQAIRAGIPYGPEVTSAEASSHATSTDRGLAFVEYQSVIAQGFRFQQVNWANTGNFPPGKNETVGVEPIIGQVGGGAARTAAGLDPRDASRELSIPEFVKSKGGEYFFTPSISALVNKIAV